jgi:mannitol-specific phosphotransferase system IIBC component
MVNLLIALLIMGPIGYFLKKHCDKLEEKDEQEYRKWVKYRERR